MAALVAVVNESIGITETLAVSIIDFSEINSPGLVDEFFYPPTIHVIPMNVPTISGTCCEEPRWTGAIFNPSRTSTFSGGEIQVSYDEGCSWAVRENYTEESLTGVVVTGASGDRNLGGAIPDHWDVYSQVTVEMTTGGFLESRTREEVYAGANRLIILGEVRAFTTAVEITPTGVPPFGTGRTFVLTDWLRGLHQTEIVDPELHPDPGSGISPVAFVVDLSGPLLTVALPIGDDGLALHYRAVDNAVQGDTEDLGFPFTMTGENLKPLKVALRAITRDVSLNAFLTWDAVTRDPKPQILSARGTSDTDATTYTIEILDAPGGAVVRTELRTTESFAYPASIQTIDFGSPQAVIYFTVKRTGTWTDGESVEGQG